MKKVLLVWLALLLGGSLKPCTALGAVTVIVDNQTGSWVRTEGWFSTGNGLMMYSDMHDFQPGISSTELFVGAIPSDYGWVWQRYGNNGGSSYGPMCSASWALWLWQSSAPSYGSTVYVKFVESGCAPSQFAISSDSKFSFTPFSAPSVYYTNKTGNVAFTNDTSRSVIIKAQTVLAGNPVATLTNGVMVLPGSAWSMAVNVTNPGPFGLPDAWQVIVSDPIRGDYAGSVGSLLSVVSTNSIPESYVATRQDVPMFTLLPSLPSSMAPVVSTPQPRVADFSTAAASAATAQANDDARAREVAQLLVGVADAQYKTAQGLAKSIGDNALFLADEMAANRAALLSGGVGSVTNTPGAVSLPSMGTNQTPSGSSVLDGFLPSVGSVANVPLGFTLPFGSLGVTGLADYSVDFAATRYGLNPVVSAVRAFILVLVTVAFFFLFVRLIRELT